MQVDLLNEQGLAASKVDVPDTVFGREYNESLVHQVVVAFQANARQGTRAQKDREQVKHSTKKPFRQKGTGRARAGMTSSPLWRGGGRIFPNMPDENFTQKINKKMYRAGMASIFSQLAREGRLAVVDSLKVDSPKTKVLADKFKAMNLKSVLVIADEVDENLYGFEVHGLELVGQHLGLGRVNLQGIHHRQPAFAGQLREDGGHAGTVHLLVDLLGEVLVGHVREDPTASAPQRRGSHTGASAAGALLTERLLGGVLDLLTVFLSTGALAGIGLEGHHHLVHQGLVVFAAEHGVRHVHLGGGQTLFVEEIDLHQFAPFAAEALTAGRTATKPPLAPGMAPLIMSS